VRSPVARSLAAPLGTAVWPLVLPGADLHLSLTNL
jgi:hypothetical protein